MSGAPGRPGGRWAEVTNTQNAVGHAYTWSLYDSGDGFADAFADRYLPVGRALRHVAADNRPLPTRSGAYPAGLISALFVAGAIALYTRGRGQRTVAWAGQFP